MRSTMRHVLLIACLSASVAGFGCTSGSDSGDGGGSGSGSGSGSMMGSGSGSQQASCPIAATTADTGALAATKALLCNQPGSMGKEHWYKVAAPMTGTMNYIEVDLYDDTGNMKGKVAPGMYAVESNLDTCGVCVRGLGDKGAAGQKEYIATSGMVNVTAVGTAGQPITVSLSNVVFKEIGTDHAVVANGCSAAVTTGSLSGSVVQMGGTGGGGGGGGGGAGACSTTVGD